MITLIDDRIYHVQFRHVRQLPKRLNAKAITTCVIVARDQSSPLRFVAIGTTVCDAADNFSRHRGRWLAFTAAINSCTRLREHYVPLRSALLGLYPHPPEKTRRVMLPDWEKKKRWEAGWEIRQKRQARRDLKNAIRGEARERAQGRELRAVTEQLKAAP
jgi:hypothetical protein